MPEKLTRDQLHEAFGLARSMANGFRAFKQAEEVIAAVLQSQGEAERLSRLIEQLRAESAQCQTEKDEAAAARAQAISDLEAEKERLTAVRGDELTKIKAAIDAEREQANRKIAAFKENVSAAETASVDARQRHEGLLAALDAEIAEKKAALDGHKAELDKLRKRLG